MAITKQTIEFARSSLMLGRLSYRSSAIFQTDCDRPIIIEDLALSFLSRPACNVIL